MNLVVCLKQVFSTEAKIRISPDGKAVSDEGVEWVMSPYDEYALEEAIRIKEATGAGTIIAITIGPDRCTPMLRSALALGADRALHLKDPMFDSVDALGVARALAAAIRRNPYDMVLFGRMGVGMDQGVIPAMVAELLGAPMAGLVVKITVDAGKVRCVREIDGGSEVVEMALPAVVTAQKGLNEPRIANLKGIMAAKKKPLDLLTAADLGLAAPDLQDVRLVHESYELPAPRTAARLLQGDPADTARQLVQILRNEAKVI